MNEKWEFGAGPSLFPAVPSPFLPPVNIFNPQFSGYGNSFGNQQFNLNTNQNMNIMIEGNNNNINFGLNKGNKEKKLNILIISKKYLKLKFLQLKGKLKLT